MSAAPQSGLRVLEVGVFMAAPFATMQPAELGAITPRTAGEAR